MSGERDPYVTPNETRAIFERLGGPKRMHLCSGVGHDSCLAAGKADWEASVAPFLARHLPASPAPSYEADRRRQSEGATARARS